MAYSAAAVAQAENELRYNLLPTMQLFHESPAQIRCIVGPVGSGKTTAAAWDVCYYLPWFLYRQHRIKKSRWVIVRNSYVELRDTTQRTVFEWFEFGTMQVQAQIYTLRYPKGPELEILFRSCDNPRHVKKFKSLEITGYWIDESIEVDDSVKKMLKNRIGRYPRQSPVRFGIETTNPPDTEHPTYSQFDWHEPPPGPKPTGVPLPNHAGFWQPPYENLANLRQNYYDDLRSDYQDDPDWIEIYIEGKPGAMAFGKTVYANFQRKLHCAREELVWSGGTLYRGWDNSGNCPACVVCQLPTAGQVQVLAEFWTDKEDIVTFTNRVIEGCNQRFPGGRYVDFADPAGDNKFSKAGGGFTSNAKLMRDECNISVIPSEQNPLARISAVDRQLRRIDGMLIDSRCTRLVNGFISGYAYPQIGTTGRYSDKPLKNRFSHVHDALQYVMVKLFTSASANDGMRSVGDMARLGSYQRRAIRR